MLRQLIAITLAALAFNAFAAVDANKANQAELETVKGIGPGLSSKILEARKASTFKDWTDFVDRVAGIGPGNAARFSQAGLTVGEQAYAAAAGTPAKSGAKVDKMDKSDKAERKGSRKAADAKPH